MQNDTKTASTVPTSAEDQSLTDLYEDMEQDMGSSEMYVSETSTDLTNKPATTPAADKNASN